MKTSLVLMTIFTFMIGSVYANQTAANYKVQVVKFEQQEHKTKFKISERRILKKQDIETAQEQISNFSMEELRVGAQQLPDKSEIQYFKSQCRYAFMSDKDVIENHCDTKKVSISK